MRRRRLVRVLVVGVALVVAAACTPPAPFRLPILYSGSGSGGLETEIAPLECADVHATLSLDLYVWIEDQPSGELIGTARGRAVVDFCRPEGDGSNHDVTGRMAFTCCLAD